MKDMKKLIVAVFLAMVSHVAANVVAVLEIIPGDDVEITIDECRYFTDELRGMATKTLPSNFSILTRDNILSLMPSDEEEAECLAEGCAVDIGRAIGAEYVTQGYIRKFRGEYSLSVELFESMSGKQLGAFTEKSKNLDSLLIVIRSEAPFMFAKIPGVKKEEPKPVAAAEPVPVVTASPEVSKLDSLAMPPPSFRVGVIAKGGFAKTSVKPGKSKFSYSAGLIFIKDFGFIDFVPEILFSMEEFEIKEKLVSMSKIEVPLSARVVLGNVLGISAGIVAAIPLSATIEDEGVKDIASFGIGMIGGLSYPFMDNVVISAYYEYYFTDNFKSLKSSNTDKALCGISYLF
ncbi:MAG: PorT family protein [Fibromonadales bacterium]|nr:PorT family protein [Fibromonadales bacterium]